MTVGLFEIPKDAPVVGVRTTSNRGFTAAELAEQAAERIVSVSDTAHPALREQAHAFQGQIAQVIEQYLKQTIRSDRTTVYNALKDAGHPELAELIRRL
jgi:predicted kinase